MIGRPYYGSIATSILSFFTASMFCLLIIKRKYKISLRPALKVFANILVGVLLMLLVMFIMKMVVPFRYDSRVLSFVITCAYALVGGSVYLAYMYFTKTVQEVFGEVDIKKILNKFKKRK
jgi:hypothetical protein